IWPRSASKCPSGGRRRRNKLPLLKTKLPMLTQLFWFSWRHRARISIFRQRLFNTGLEMSSQLRGAKFIEARRKRTQVEWGRAAEFELATGRVRPMADRTDIAPTTEVSRKLIRRSGLR